MGTLDKEIEAFEKMKSTLVEHHPGKFVIIYKEKLVGSYDTFENAAKEAVNRFGKGPYLIRKVGDEPFVLPVSVAYKALYAHN